MVEKNPPVWMQAGTYNATDDRIVSGLLSDRNRGSAGTGSDILGGVVPGFAQLQVTANGANMQISVAAGTVVIPAVGINPPGAYICFNEGAEAITLDVEASANPRIDVIYAEVEDQTAGDDESLWRLAVLKGSPSAAPVTPSLSADRFPIASVRVLPASQNGGVNKVTTAQVTDLRRMLTSINGQHLTKNGMPNPPHAPGRLLYNQDSKQLYMSNGTSWDWLYTYQQWQQYFAANRPKHAGVSAAYDVGTGAGNFAVWKNTGHQLTGVRTPSGSLKVTISGLGKLLSAGNSNLHMSVRILQGSTTVFTPSTGWRSVHWYSTTWLQSTATFLATGLPVNTDLTVRCELYRHGASTGPACRAQNRYLLVEPVL